MSVLQRRAAPLLALAAVAAAAAAPDARRLLGEGARSQCNPTMPVSDVKRLSQEHECRNCSKAWTAALGACHAAGGHTSWAGAMAHARTEDPELRPLLRPDACDRGDYGFDADGVPEAEAREARAWFEAHVAVYVVNLEKDTRRWERISHRLSELHIPFQRIPGVDLTAPQAFQAARWEGLLPESFNFTKAEDNFNRTRHNAGGITGTVGCAAAHLRAMRIVSHMQGERPRPLALILEDDVRLADDFMVMLRRLLEDEAPCDWEAIALQSLCPFGACVSRHLSRVVPAAPGREARCEQGVNLGFSGMVYRVSALDGLRAKLAESVWDDANPSCLDVDVAMASIADEVSYYAVPGALSKGLLEVVETESSRLAFNEDFAGWTAWSGGLSGGAKFRTRSDQFWEVVSAKPVDVRSGKSDDSDLLSVKRNAEIVRGLEDGQWVSLVAEPGFVRINGTSSATRLRQAEAIYSFWNAAELDHTFHAGGPWVGEDRQRPEFFAFAEPAEGTDPVYRFSLYFQGRLEYTFHFGEAREGETRQGVEFYAFSYEAQGTEPVHEFWHEVHREHTLHMGEPREGEARRKVQFWAYPAPAERPKPEPHGFRPCFTRGVTYQPLLMMGELKAGEASPAGCQELCKATEDCAYFSFFPWDGSCHFARSGAYVQNGSWGTVSGPRACNVSHANSSYAHELAKVMKLADARHEVRVGAGGDPAAGGAQPSLVPAALGFASGTTALALLALGLRRRSARSAAARVGYHRTLITTEQEEEDFVDAEAAAQCLAVE